MELDVLSYLISLVSIVSHRFGLLEHRSTVGHKLQGFAHVLHFFEPVRWDLL